MERLLADQSALADLRAFLSAEDLYVVTANAFPYGPFKNRLVMETVFEPDWRDRRRAEYTKGVATILASIAGDGVSPTIQTAPLGFKPHVTPGVVERFTEHVLQRRRPSRRAGPDDGDDGAAGPRAGAVLPRGDDRGGDPLLP